MISLFGWQFANERKYEDSPTKVSIDWTSPEFGRAFAVNVLFRCMNESHYIFVYWIVGTFFEDVETLTLSVGIIRSFESVGSCLAFGIGAAKVFPMVNLIVAFVMFVLCVPPTFYLTWQVPEHPQDIRKQLDGESNHLDEESTRAAT